MELRNVRFIIATTLAILASTMLVAPAFAGQPAGVTVSVKQTGIGPEGKGLMSSAQGLQYTADNAFIQTFDGNGYDATQSWVAMWSGEVGNNVPYSVGAYYPYSGMKVYDFRVWNGQSCLDFNADVTVSIEDPASEKIWDIVWQDEFGDYQEKYLKNGQSWSFQMTVPKLSGPDQWSLGAQIDVSAMTPVPEPGSIVAMLSGLVGLAGFGLRRRA